MIGSPNIIAILAASSLTAVTTLAASILGFVILRRWDPGSGSELQLRLERLTHLVSTLLAVTLLFRLPMLFLFISTADAMSSSIVGAMCAFGTLHVNSHGFPALFAETGFFLAGSLWLIMNRLDMQGYDYPLIRFKYRFLIAMTPVAMIALVEMFRFFLNISPDVITSCCGSLFSQRPGVEISDIFVMPIPPLYASTLMLMGTGALMPFFASRWSHAPLFQGGVSLAAFPLAIVFVITAVSPYVYELPTHHCPFCILKREYGYVGYLLYGTLLVSTATGTGAGLASLFRKAPSLSSVIPRFVRRLSGMSSLSSLIFLTTATLCIILSNLRI